MAATNLNTVRSTIEGRLKTEMEGGAPPIPVVFSNVGYKPKANKSFVLEIFLFIILIINYKNKN